MVQPHRPGARTIIGYSAPENAWSLACRQSLGDFCSLADVEWLAMQAQPARENAFRNLILNQRVASEARFMDQAHGALA